MTADYAAKDRTEGDSLVDAAIEKVRLHIAAHHLRVGDTIPSEAQFALEHGFSRAVVREAFRALGTLRVLDVGNGRRARVGALDASAFATAVGHGMITAQISIADVWDARRTIEMRTVVLASEHRTSAEAIEIGAHAEALAVGRDDPVQRVLHDMAFHAAIARASRNGLLQQITLAFAPQMQTSVPAAWRTRVELEQRDAVIERHRAIARAIVNQDPAAASEAMARHFDKSVDDILRGYEGSDPFHGL